MYVAIQIGVYRHTILGIFSSSRNAIIAGKQAILDEKDHYHDIEIVEMLGDSFTSDKQEEKIICTLVWDKRTQTVEQQA